MSFLAIARASSLYRDSVFMVCLLVCVLRYILDANASSGYPLSVIIPVKRKRAVVLHSVDNTVHIFASFAENVMQMRVPSVISCRHDLEGELIPR